MSIELPAPPDAQKRGEILDRLERCNAELTTAEMMKVIPRHCFEKSAWRGALGIAISIGASIGAWWLLAWNLY